MATDSLFLGLALLEWNGAMKWLGGKLKTDAASICRLLQFCFLVFHHDPGRCFFSFLTKQSTRSKEPFNPLAWSEDCSFVRPALFLYVNKLNRTNNNNSYLVCVGVLRRLEWIKAQTD